MIPERGLRCTRPDRGARTSQRRGRRAGAPVQGIRHYVTDALAGDWFDPADDHGDPTSVLEMSAGNLYQASLQGVLEAIGEGESLGELTVMDRRIHASRLDRADLTVGLDAEIAAAVRNDPSALEKIVRDYSPAHRPNELEYLGPTGVWVSLGQSWRPDR